MDQERRWLAPRTWIGPGLLSLVLLFEVLWVLVGQGAQDAIGAHPIGAIEVGVALFGPYLLAVELASMLLLAGLVAALHLGRHD